MSDLLANVRQSLRRLTREPGTAVVLLLGLALGVGATTAMFSILDAVLLRPLPFPQPRELMVMVGTDATHGADHEGLSPVDLDDFRKLDHLHGGFAAWWYPQLNLSDEYGEPVRVGIADVTDRFFETLGVRPALGRGFRPGEDQPGADPVLVIGNRLWRQRYGADPEILGRSIELDGTAYSVVGVAPPGFDFPGDVEVWRPLGWQLAFHSRQARFMGAILRLAPEIDRERAQRELSTLADRLAGEHPDTNHGWGVRLVPLRDELVGGFRRGLWLLFAATALLLLLACANAANLLLMQAAAHQRELAIRSALGAAMRHLRLHFFGESLLRGVIAGALAVPLAGLTLRWLVLSTPFEMPGVEHAGLTTRTLLFAAAASLVSAVVFGSLPALRIRWVKVAQALTEHGDGRTARFAASRGRRLLVVLQVTLATLLSVAAGLLTGSFWEITRQDPGIEADGVIATNLQLPVAKYGDWNRVEQFYRQLRERLASRPEIVEATLASHLPLDASWPMPLSVPGHVVGRTEDEPTAQFRVVGPGYFETLGISLAQGRGFGDRDTATSAGVVVINQEAADRYWSGRNPLHTFLSTPIRTLGPLGQSLLAGDRYEVIGVVHNVRNNSLISPVEPEVYFTFRQFPYRSLHILARARPGTASLVDELRAEVDRLDPTLALSDPREMPSILADSVADRRFSMLLVSSFASFALLLAAIGVYGVLSYDVASRRKEIGVRMALGAGARDILVLVGREGLLLTGSGLLAGLLLSRLANQALARFLYGISAGDWQALGAVIAVVAISALLAALGPALRAAAVDPITALRQG